MNKYLIEILKIQSSVILPGLGALMVPSQKSGKIVFNPHLKFNDGSLAKFIAEKESIDVQAAQNKVAKFVREIEAELGKGNTYNVFEFGEFYKNKDGVVDFNMAGSEEPSRPSVEENNTTTSTVKVTPPVKEDSVVTEKLITDKIDPLKKEIVPPTTETKIEIPQKEQVTLNPSLEKTIADKIDPLKKEVVPPAAETKIEIPQKEQVTPNPPLEKTIADKIEALKKEVTPTAETKTEVPQKEQVTPTTPTEKPANVFIPPTNKSENLTDKITEGITKKTEELKTSATEKVDEIKKAVETKTEELKENVKSSTDQTKKSLGAIINGNDDSDKDKQRKNKFTPAEDKKKFAPVKPDRTEIKEEKKKAVAPIKEHKVVEKTASTVTTAKKVVKKEEKKKSKLPWIILLLVLLGLGATGFVFKDKIMAFFSKDKDQKEIATADKDKISATDNETLDTTEDEMVTDSLGTEEMTNEEGMEEDEASEHTPTTETENNTVNDVAIDNSTAGNYHLIGNSFREKSNAESYVSTMKDKGYPAKIVGKFDGLYLVSIKSYSSRQNAQNGMSSVSADATGTWIFKH